MSILTNSIIKFKESVDVSSKNILNLVPVMDNHHVMVFNFKCLY